MTPGRLEAFSDGVLAIIITIMVLELHAPEGHDWAALQPLVPVFLAYVLSFLYVAIYWNNHHHLLKSAHSINARIMWSNMGLLFSLSLFPFATAWMGENHAEPIPTFAYGCVMLAAGVTYFLLEQSIIANEGGRDSAVSRALGRDKKGQISLVCYLASMAFAFVLPVASIVLFVAVAVLWLVPDRRLERVEPHEH